jgi:hypothetical protein
MPSSHIEELLDPTLFASYYKEIRKERIGKIARQVDKVEVRVAWERGTEK